MKASVLILSYNSGPILEQCKDSVLDQALDDYEVVLVDNSSTDGSFERVKDRFAGHPKFRVFCLRARRAGFEVGVASQAAIHHHLSHSESELGGQRLHLTDRKVCRDGKVPRGTFRDAWLWKLKRLGSVLEFRATANRNGFDLGSRLRPTWGYAPFQDYNRALRPRRGQWTAGCSPRPR